MIINTNRPIRIVVLGCAKSGKSAVTVRYLTRRYIGEYSSSKDFLYHHSFNCEDIKTEVEIMDTSSFYKDQCLYEHISWADAFVVVYSVCDRKSFIQAGHFLETITMLKAPIRFPIILLGNKRDLEHAREVPVEDGQEMSLLWKCQFYEVSAAESYIGVRLAFQNLIREAKPANGLKTVPLRRKTSPAMTVSKVIGIMFGKTGSKACRSDKKRPSLSI